MVRREVLPNGLRLLVREMHTAPVVALNLWVGAGSADDPEGLGGIAHFLEHMLFRGAGKGAAVDVALEVQSAGGYLNARTGFDHTVYYQVVPSACWADILRAQAEAIATPTFTADDVKRERSVIIEEAKSAESDPSFFVWQRLLETAFTEHPWRLPITGTDDSLRRINASHLTESWARHYTAGNMVQVVVGDVDPDEVVRQARESVGSIRSGDRPAPTIPSELGGDGLRARSFNGALEQSYLALGFHIPSALDPDIPALDALCGLLGVGRSSRLRKSLHLKKGLVRDVGAGIAAHTHAGLLVVRATLEGRDVYRAVEEIFKEVARLREVEAEAAEMQKNLRRLEASYVLEHETADTVAATLGLFETLGDYEWGEEYVDRLASVTPEDVRRVARDFVRPENATVVCYVPESSSIPEGDRSGDFARLVRIGNGRPLGDRVAEQRSTWEAPSGLTRPMLVSESVPLKCSRATLSSGASVVIGESGALPLASMALGFVGGQAGEPKDHLGVTYLTQNLLLRGTTTRSAEEIADDIEGLGSAVATAVDRDGFGLGATVLSKHLGDALSVLSDVVTRPSLGEDRMSAARVEVEGEIGEIEDHPVRHATVLLLPLLFPDHVYGRPLRGTRETLARIKVEDVVRWHSQLYVASNLHVCVVGDVSRERVVDELEKALSHMKRGDAAFAGRPVSTRPAGRVEETQGRVTQSTVALGFPGPRAGTDDSTVMHVVARALTMVGGRLWVALRERPPFAYVAGASQISLRCGGAFLAYATAEPGREEAVREALVSEFGRLRDSGLGDDELARAKRHLAGTHEISMQRGSVRAASYAMAEVVGVGYERVEDMPRAIRAVTNEGVVEAVRRYLDPGTGVAEVCLRPE
jgi:zinc protease